MWPFKRNPKLLLVGGGGEAVAVSHMLAQMPAGRDALLYWWGARPKVPALPAAEFHPPFYSADLFENALRVNKCTHLLDVSHGFEGRISTMAAAACRSVGVPYVYLRRPAWQPRDGDIWHNVPDMAAAREAIAPFSRVFTNVGRGLLPDLRGFAGHLWVRQTVAHANKPVLDNASFVFGTPPFDQKEEEALFTELGIDAVLFRNTGGDASASKVWAARALGLPMIMLSRPDSPEGLRLSSTDDVRDWAQGL